MEKARFFLGTSFCSGNIVGHISDKVIIIIIIMQRLMRHVSVIRMTNRSYSEVSSSNSSSSGSK